MMEEEKKGSIKNKKALKMAISDKATPQAINNLKKTMNLVILILITLSVVEYLVTKNLFL
jgi:hypothetical protein